MADFPIKMVPWRATEQVQDALTLSNTEVAWLSSKMQSAVGMLAHAGAAGPLLDFLQQQYPEVQQGTDALIREWVVRGLWSQLRHGTGGNQPPQFFRRYRNSGTGCETLPSAELILADKWIDPPAETVGLAIGPVSLAVSVELSVENVDEQPHRIHHCGTGEDEDDIYAHRARLFSYRIAMRLRITGNVTWSADRFLMREQWVRTDCCPLDEIEQEIEYGRVDRPQRMIEARIV